MEETTSTPMERVNVSLALLFFLSDDFRLEYTNYRRLVYTNCTLNCARSRKRREKNGMSLQRDRRVINEERKFQELRKRADLLSPVFSILERGQDKESMSLDALCSLLISEFRTYGEMEET
jgi:hypothetical protein